MIRYVLTDIEGTTTSISFVKDKLFPYFLERFNAFLAQNARLPEVRRQLEAVKSELRYEGAARIDDEAAVAALRRWTMEDRKHGALKALQGLVWRAGYASGALKADLYEDVPPVLKRWREGGARLGVYSSGSVAAQKLLFAHTEHGDLTDLFSHHFDTAVGGKKEADSYRAICEAIDCAPGAVLFLSDAEAELDAAKEAGLAALQVVRPQDDTRPSDRHPAVESFADIVLSDF